MSNSIVLDSNVVLKWLSGPKEQLFQEAQIIYQDIQSQKIQALAPDFLLIEVSNILLHKWKADPHLTHDAVHRLQKSRITFFSLQEIHIDKIFQNSVKHQITSYDSIFLTLAENHHTQLITEDTLLLKQKDSTLNILEYIKNR